MKFLVIYSLKPNIPFEQVKPHLLDEEAFAFRSMLAGSLREIYETDALPGGTVCLLEEESREALEARYAELPLVKRGFLERQIIPLAPFSRWKMLLREDVLAKLN